MHKILKILSPAMVTLALMSSLPHVALSANAMQVPDSEAIASEEQIKIATLNNDVMEVYDTFESAAKSLQLSKSDKIIIGQHVQEAKANGAPVVYIEPQIVNGFQTYVVSYNKQDGTSQHYIVYNVAEKGGEAQKYLNSIASGEKGAERMRKLNDQYDKKVENQHLELTGIMAKAKNMDNMDSKEVGALYDKVRTLTALDEKTRDSAEASLTQQVQGSSPIRSSKLPTVGGAGVSDSGSRGSDSGSDAPTALRQDLDTFKPISRREPALQTSEVRSILAKAEPGMSKERRDDLYKKVDQLTGVDEQTKQLAKEAIARKIYGKSRRERGAHKTYDSNHRRKRGDHKPSEKQKSEHTEQEKSVLSKINDRLFGKKPNAKKDLTQARRQSDEERAIAEDE